MEIMQNLITYEFKDYFALININIRGDIEIRFRCEENL